jgi:hypothetical protein
VATVDYAFTLDADEELWIEPKLNIAALKAQLTADLYEVDVVLDESTVYPRHCLFSNRSPFAYRGVVHEYLEAPPDVTRGGKLAGLQVISRHEGARSKKPERYAEDARLLEAALTRETDPTLISRYTFYLAQSYRDSGQYQKSHEAYLQRVEQAAGRKRSMSVSCVPHRC